VVFSQSQGLGWERGSGGVAVDPGVRGQEGYTRDISMSQKRCLLGGGGGSPYSNQCYICHREVFLKSTLTPLTLCIIRGGSDRGGDEGRYGPGRD